MNRPCLTLIATGFVIFLAAGLPGCKSSTGPGGQIPDGFVTTGCALATDCDDGMKCHVPACNPTTHMCEYTDKPCSAPDACNSGTCDPTSGQCISTPANAGSTCTTTNAQAGTCQSGICTPVPSCADPNFTSYASCDDGDLSLVQGNNDPASFGGGAANINSYACAPTENGPELSFVLYHDPAAGDEDITVSLRPTMPDGTPATTDNFDLDLIVLETSCNSGATCMNPAITAGGFQGVTTGTSKERVTFHAIANKTYYIVIDGKNMNQATDFAIEVEACGKCQPTDATRVSCDMTMPINANTMTGTSKISSYTCTTPAGTVAAAGKEIPFFFQTDNVAARKITATLTGVTSGTDVKLLALPTNVSGECDPMNCIASADDASGGTVTLPFNIDPSTESGENNSYFGKYWIVVDAATTTDSPFGLEIACSPYCIADAFNGLSCGGVVTETKQAMSTTKPPTGIVQSTQYGPMGSPCGALTGLSGPETAIQFTAQATGQKNYTIELQAAAGGKDLSFVVLDAGTMSGAACDPTLACATFVASHPTGSTGTLTTNLAATQTAAATLTALSTHIYYILVDGVDASGSDFTLSIAGIDPGAGCP